MDAYFKFISDNMRAQSRLIAEFFRTHPGENGRNKEAILLNFLKSYLPGRYSLGTGFITSSDQVLSNQNDIVIYDGFWSSSLFPEVVSRQYLIECVYAVIEVKSLLDKSQLKTTVDKATIIKKMQVKGIKKHGDVGLDNPCFCLFAYDSTDLIELKEELQKYYINTPLSERIDFVVVLNKGMMFTGEYYAIAKYGQPGSQHRLSLGEEGIRKLKEKNPSEIEGMQLQEDTLLIFFSYLMCYLSQSKDKIANWIDYLPNKTWGEFF